MFWGLIMEPQRRYTQQVKKAFHISMAALDLSTSSDEPAQVMCGFEGRNYLLCTLKKPNMLQCPLDLNFEVGDEVSFAANGKCYVHLTGYLIDQPLDEDEDEDEVEEEQEEEVEVPKKTRKRNKKLLENGPPVKKPKSSEVSSSQDQDESDSDSDLNVKDLLGKSFDSDDEDDSDAVADEEGEEEEDDDNVEEEEEGEEEEEDEEDEESSSSENESGEEEEVSKPKVNGVPKKQKQEDKKKQKLEKKKQEKHIEEVKKSPKNEQKKDTKTPNKENKSPKKRTLTGGVVVEDIKEGDGALAKNGRFVSVYYEGRLKHNNKLFDSTTQGTGFGFRLGGNEVIKGWNIGIAGMKVGGKRRFICPPEMAYGKAGSHPAIPPNASLVFDVELRKVS